MPLRRIQPNVNGVVPPVDNGKVGKAIAVEVRGHNSLGPHPSFVSEWLGERAISVPRQDEKLAVSGDREINLAIAVEVSGGGTTYVVGNVIERVLRRSKCPIAIAQVDADGARLRVRVSKTSHIG